MITKVRRALTPSGVLKSETPSEMASRPVNEDPPFAKARSKINIAATVKSPCEWPIGITPSTFVSNFGSVPLIERKIPIPNTTARDPAKK